MGRGRGGGQRQCALSDGPSARHRGAAGPACSRSLLSAPPTPPARLWPWPLRSPVAFRTDATAWVPILPGKSRVKSWAAWWKEALGREGTSRLRNKARWGGGWARILVALARCQCPRHTRQGLAPERVEAVPLAPARSPGASAVTGLVTIVLGAPCSLSLLLSTLPAASKTLMGGWHRQPQQAWRGEGGKGAFLDCFLFGNCH